MKKTIKDLTDEEIFKYIYGEWTDDMFKKYTDRPDYPKDTNLPAATIRFDNCRYCRYSDEVCDIDCGYEPENIIDTTAIRTGIYRDDEINITNEEVK